MEKLTFKVCDYCHGKMLPQTMSHVHGVVADALDVAADDEPNISI